MLDTHYVLVIHGTFDRPSDNKPRWYQLRPDQPDNFCSRLNDRLGERGLPSSVWRTTPVEEQFRWSGDNDHDARTEAASSLLSKIIDVTSKDPTARIHLVGHSHGGNVILKAVERYLTRLDLEAKVLLASYKGPSAKDPKAPEWLQEVEEDLRKTPDALFNHPAYSFVNFDDLASLYDKARRLVLESQCDGHLHGQLKKLLRNKNLLAREWASSQETNRLGTVVCFGTPFLHKRWDSGWPQVMNQAVFTLFWGVPLLFILCWQIVISLNGHLEDVKISITSDSVFAWPNVVAALLIPAVLIYFGAREIHSGTRLRDYSPAEVLRLSLEYLFVYISAATMVLIFLVLLPFWIRQNGTRAIEDLNPMTWPAWLTVFGVVICAVLLAAVMSGTSYRDTNIYFDSWVVKSLGPLRRRVPILTISAPYLDEALLALSAEPIMRSQIEPRLRQQIWPPIRWRFWQRPAGVTPSLLFATLRAFGSILVGAVWLLGRCATRVITYPFRFILESIIRGILRKLLVSAATGLPSWEMKRARIEVRARLDMPSIFDETSWDVTRRLVGRPLIRGRSGADSEQIQLEQRYAYLWNECELTRKAATSRLWQAVLKTLAASPYSQSKQLMQGSILIEQRLEELVGAVDYIHCTYYRDDVITDAIAEFIVTGRYSRGQASPRALP